VRRFCALQVPILCSPMLENFVFPDRERIVAAARAMLDAPVYAASV
jgi:hypothetical protein